MGKSRQKADHRADTRGGPWAGIPHYVIDSAAYRHLSLWARALLVEIVREMNGFNNGKIVLSQRQMASRLNTSNFRKIGRGIAELMQHGFIDVAIEGQWKTRMAREYRLTFVNTGKPGHYRPATNDYVQWAPTKKSGADARSARAGKRAEGASADRRNAADASSAATYPVKEQKPLSAADEGSSLISEPYPWHSGPPASAAFHCSMKNRQVC